MKCINRILKLAGMSQQALADYLGIKRQSLMDAATGRKTLSPKLISKLHRLDVCIALAETDASQDLVSYRGFAKPVPPGKSCGHDIDTLNKCRNKAKVFQKKLDSLEMIRSQNILLLKVLERMEPTDNMEEQWIAIAKGDAAKMLNNCSEDECDSLRKRIHLLHAEADYLTRYLNEKNLLNENSKQIQ